MIIITGNKGGFFQTRVRVFNCTVTFGVGNGGHGYEEK